jgi:hypothetical protein
MGFGVSSVGGASGATDVDVAGSPSLSLSQTAAVAAAADAVADAADVELVSGTERSVFSTVEDRLFDLTPNGRAPNYAFEP